MTHQFNNPSVIQVSSPFIFEADHIFRTEGWYGMAGQVAAGIYHFDNNVDAEDLYSRFVHLAGMSADAVTLRPLSSIDRGHYDPSNLPAGNYMFSASVIEYLDKYYSQFGGAGLLNGLRITKGFYNTIDLENALVPTIGLIGWHGMECDIITAMILPK